MGENIKTREVSFSRLNEFIEFLSATCSSFATSPATTDLLYLQNNVIWLGGPSPRDKMVQSLSFIAQFHPK